MTLARTVLPRIAPLFPLALAACHPAKLAVPSDVAAATEVLEARNRSGASGMFVNEDFEIGEYRVRDVDRSAESRTRWSFGDASQTSGDGGYAYRLEGGDAPLEGACRYTNEKTSVRDGFLGGTVSTATQSFTCACGADARVDLKSGPGAGLSLFGRDESLFVGPLQLGGATYQARSLHGFEGGAKVPEAVGYRVDRDGPFAAVDTLPPGRVFLPRSIAPADRAKLTCLLAGMMLYVAPSEHRH
jgi:hypothetical protein